VNLLTIFLENLLPVMALAALGFLVQRLLRLDPRPLSQIVFYVFSPALVFTLLLSAPFNLAEMGRMALLVLALLAVLAFAAWVLARMLRLNRTMTSAVILCVTFMNAGNLGLPITQLAFGAVTLAWATVFFSTTSLAANSAGAWIASLGRTGAWRALIGLAKVPAVYAIPLALLMHERGIILPSPVMTPINLLAAATIPSMLLILGMQLAVNGRPVRPKLLLATTFARLIASPVIAWGFLALLPLPPEAARASILESAMPTAVLTSILAAQYEVEPEFVSGSILLTTLLSPLTLSPILYLLQRWG
jgi:predicted permease